MNPEGGAQIHPQETRMHSEPTLRFSANHADKLFGNKIVRRIFMDGGVTFPKPSDTGHMEKAVEVPVSVINSIVTMNENRQLGAHGFWVVQQTVQHEVSNTPPPDLSLRTYEKILEVCESNGSVTGEQHSMISDTAESAKKMRKQFDAIRVINSRLLPPEFEVPDMEEVDNTLAKFNDRAKSLGIQIEMNDKS